MSSEATLVRDRAILIVDDEPLILMALRRELRDGLGPGYLYETAGDGEEGLEIVEELVASGIRVVLVVSDWLMPGMKGDEFLLELRRRYPQIRTIMMTGQADEHQIERIKQAGALDAFFFKPWNALHFSETCKTLIAAASA
ncbi:MAG: response regulator [Treponema sp.]|nr:response regulator [Treponema sp.]